jgi:hypothetical protein
VSDQEAALRRFALGMCAGLWGLPSDLEGPAKDAPAWHRIERHGGLARVDGRPGMYVRAGGPEARWRDRLGGGE